MIELVIPGPPIAQKRPRLGRSGAYNPNAKQKRVIRQIIQCQANKSNLSASGDHFDVTMYLMYTPPISWSQKRQKQAIQAKLTPPTAHDCDNTAKFYLDCCNGIVFEDDRLVSSLTVQKMWGEIDQTIIQVTPLNIRR